MTAAPSLPRRLSFAVLAILAATSPSLASEPAPTSEPLPLDEIVETSRYSGRPGTVGLLSRRSVLQISESQPPAEDLSGLDERREAIIDAIWQDDREAFLRLAADPEGGGLANQSFEEISRMFRPYRKEGFRTMRKPPIHPTDTEKGKESIWCHHHWMTLPEGSGATPKRGNLILVFDSGSLALRFVRLHPQQRGQKPNLLPDPDTSLPWDIVRDLAAPEPAARR